MKIALVSVPVWTIETPPLNVSYLKAYIEREGHTAKCFDVNTELYHKTKPEFQDYWRQAHYFKWQENQQYSETVFPQVVKPYIAYFVEKILEFKPDIIGISVYSNCFTRTLAKELKKRNKNLLIVVGGQVCNDQLQGVPLKQSTDIDIIVKGEGEVTLKRIADSFAKNGKVDDCPGCLIRRGKEFIDCGDYERIQNIDSLPCPDFSDYDLSIYFDDFDTSKPSKSLPILISRGCNTPCDFCIQRVIWKSKLFTRKAEYVFDEMVRNKEKHGISKFVFADLLINGNIIELEKLCDLIIKNDFSCSWWGSAKVDKRMSIDLFKKMKKAGCHQLALGIESASSPVLKAMGKPSTAEDVKNFVTLMKEAGISICSNLIIGYPSETRQGFTDTLKFLSENKDIITTQPWPSVCVIFRGTGLYNKYINDKDFKYVNANDWSYKENTPDERKYRVEAYKRFCLSTYDQFDMFNQERVEKGEKHKGNCVE